MSARIWRFSSQRSALMPCNSRFRAWLPSCTVGCSSSPSAAWLRWVTRTDCCFSSSVRFTASAHASRQSSNCSGLFHRAHSGFCRPNFTAFGCFEQRFHPGSRAACVGVSHADTPAVFLYLYCFSQPFSFACKNSCAVKPRSSSALRHRYSFCVLPCHFPWTSNGRIVSIMCAWGLCPSGSWMAKSAHIPLSTHSVWMKPRRSSSQSSRPSSTGRATINWRARRLSLVFSADSTAAHRVCRSFHAAGAWGGSKISV